jgi:hypothetical protein
MRASVHEAAEVFGTTVDAIRKRVQRDTIAHEKDEDGRVWILLEGEVYDRTRHDTAQDTTGPRPDDRTDSTDILIAELQDRVRSLEEANRENRRIIAALTQRIPAIEAPAETPSQGQEPPRTPTEATEQPGRMEPQSNTVHEPARRPPWWLVALLVLLLLVSVAFLAFFAIVASR